MRRSPWATLAVLALAQFIVVLDVTIVNVALPHIQADLDFSAVIATILGQDTVRG
jgi:MFS family permease